MSKNKIPILSIISDKSLNKISVWGQKNPGIPSLVKFLSSEFQIDCKREREIIQAFDRDYSNINGKAEALCRPVDEYECALILYVGSQQK